MAAIIENAAYVQDYLERKKYGRHFMIHAKAVLGELTRNAKYFSNIEIINSFADYKRKVGFGFIVNLILVYTLMFKKFIK